MPSRRTSERPRLLGRKVERLAKTPTRRLPPRRGGRTVGFQPCPVVAWKPKINHRWENPSIPRMISGLRKDSWKTTCPHALGHKPGWRGTPNFPPKHVWTVATGSRIIG